VRLDDIAVARACNHLVVDSLEQNKNIFLHIFRRSHRLTVIKPLAPHDRNVSQWLGADRTVIDRPFDETSSSSPA